jgi:hypothetical protein
MKETGRHSFDPKESTKFSIYYGDNLRITPERAQLGKVYPNPTNGLTSINFSLPETGGINQSVTLDIIDALGRTVGLLKQEVFIPGYHKVTFDVSGMMAGLYTYRLTVRNIQGEAVHVKKLVIK